SARCGSSRAATPVTHPWRPGWCPGSDIACSAMHSSPRGEGAKTTCSCRSPVMSMCTLMPPSCTPPLTTPSSIDAARQSTEYRGRREPLAQRLGDHARVGDVRGQPGQLAVQARECGQDGRELLEDHASVAVPPGLRLVDQGLRAGERGAAEGLEGLVERHVDA